MKALLATLLLALLPVSAPEAGESYACNMGALSKSERSSYAKLTRRVRASAEEQRELANGYGFRFPAASLVTVAQWVAFESRCCPFFAFELKLGANGGPLWLEVTGGEGIKEFIRAEFGLDS